MGNKNFIEINGKKYDALTGQLLSTPAESAQQKPVVSVKPNQSTGVVDGFVRRQKPATHRTTAHSAVKQPQKSNTLMRTAVQKPQSVVHKVKAEKPTIQKSHLGSSVRRTAIAMNTPKSPQVNKFDSTTHRTSVIKTTQPNMQVKQPPASTKQVATPTVHAPQSQQPHTQTQSQKMTEAALAHAKSHETEASTHHTKKRGKFARKLGVSKRTFSIGTSALAVVLLAGFFAVQNVPNLSMRVAATRAGFDASMPGYRPSGFSFKGPIKYSPGSVTVSFSSNTDDRYYQVTQKSSNWNSDALLANFVVAEGKQYQTFLDRGRTLYIYDQSNATWVDDGVWYQIEGESDMTTDQLIRIASSI